MTKSDRIQFDKCLQELRALRMEVGNLSSQTARVEHEVKAARADYTATDVGKSGRTDRIALEQRLNAVVSERDEAVRSAWRDGTRQAMDTMRALLGDLIRSVVTHTKG